MKQSCQPIQTALVGLNFGAGLADCQIFNGAGGEFIRIVAVCDRNLVSWMQTGDSQPMSSISSAVRVPMPE